jgi:hypothetical protein
MLARMFRVALIALVFAGASCSKSAGNQEKPAQAPPAPVADKAAPTADPPAPPAGGACASDDPRFHIKPEEGTLTIGAAEGAAGAEASASIKVTPGTGYHVSTEFPMKLTLEAPAGVTLAKTQLAKGDADQFTEQGLSLTVKATADKPGSYEIHGCFKVGVCDKDSCHPKKQPITITVAAK